MSFGEHSWELSGPTLVTGSSGLVGAAIAHRLSQRGKVRGIDRRPGSHTSHCADIRDETAVRTALQGCVAIVHTASLHAPHVGYVSDEEFRLINIEGTRGLLKLATQAGVHRFVFTSSTSVFGAAMENPTACVWVDEMLMPIPRDIYDRTKLEAERLCAAWAESPGRTCLALRISRCFPESPHVMLLHRLHRGVDIRDVAEAHALALEAPLSGFFSAVISAQTPFERVDATQLKHEPISVIRNRCPEIERHFLRNGWALPRSIDRVYDIEKAHQILGYRPRYNHRELMDEMR